MKNLRINSILSRRSFLQWALGLAGGAALSPLFPSRPAIAGAGPGKRLIFLAVDGLHPAYLSLDARGFPGGGPGNRLMPNLHKFLEQSLWFPEAQAYLPAATDMNHLNALAGTSAAGHGIIGVWAQPVGWDKKGRAIIAHSALADARDASGRPVDTLFHAWKRQRPGGLTFFISGKEWVADMFRQDPRGGFDLLVTGKGRPDWLPEPEKGSFSDPPTDPDAACDPEGGRQGIFGGRGWGASPLWTRMYTGQGSLLTLQMEHFASRFPHDSWIVDSTLAVFDRQPPDLAYVLLAQCDDGGHCMGSAWDPGEFTAADPPHEPPRGCESRPEWQLVSRRNPRIFREPCLDVIRDVDFQFGRLVDGLAARGILDQACVVLLSDHSAVNHLATDDFASTDIMGILEGAGLVRDGNVYTFSVSSYGVLYWRDRKEQVGRAKRALLAHRAKNPETGETECPWWVLDREEMKNGLPGISLPGELYHRYFVEQDQEQSMIWPDLFVLARNGWQIPVYNGHVPNVGIKAPKWTPPFRVYNGGHGSVDTLPILAAIRVPGGRTGVSPSPIRIADLGVTAASLFGLTLQSANAGRDLSGELLG
ncbi:MAG: alkaline phosphatase family protein [Proteobacteria bacterium]|nr:alkaline phosphatase family protein [Pseudomonadota bacterium]